MPKKILVVDRDSLIRQRLSLFLCEEGYEISEARDGDEALELVHNFRFDLVLSDLHFPSLDEMAILSHLRSISPNIPIIIMMENRYVNLSATHPRGVFCISKPLSLEALRSQIAELIQQ